MSVLVIFGAGASNDAANRWSDSSRPPPLTNEFEATDAVDLRLAREVIWISDGLSEGLCTVVCNQLRDNCGQHLRHVATRHGGSVAAVTLSS